MTTFDTTETRLWLDTKCAGCRKGLRVPVSPYGHLLTDHFTRTHECQVIL